jgi:acyl-coenzyme A synthetase/AMP-(fatty) acid ligase
MARLEDDVTRAFAAFSSRTAIVWHEDKPARAVTYAELAARVGHWRGELVRAGLRPGHIVPIFARRSPDAIALVIAVVLEGAAYAWLNPKCKPPQLQRAAGECAASVITDAVLAAEPLAWRADEARADGAACVLYTSGSTGAPKGVRIAGDDLVARARTEIDAFGLTPDDAVLCVLPFSFDVGANQLWSALLAGATLHVAAAWLRGDLADVIERAQITGLSAVPSIWSTALAGLAPDEWLFGERSTLRYVTISGGSLAPTAFTTLSARLGAHVDIHKTYGQSETFRSAIFLSAQRPEHRARIGSVGRAPAGVTLAIARDGDARADPGEEGEVIHAGCGTMLGYLADQALTRTKLGRHPAAPATVVYTGDRGVLDADGYLTLRGRADAMIKSNGFRVYPKEVEDALAEHPHVVEAAVFGIPDPYTGERVIAVVVARSGVEPRELRAFVAGRLPDYMVPRHIALWPRLPRTATGKPALSEIRERFTAEPG